MAEWSGALVPSPAIRRLRAQFLSPLGRATFPTTGASVTALKHICMAVIVMSYTNIWGNGQKLEKKLTRPKTPIIIIIHGYSHVSRVTCHLPTFCW